MNSCAQKPTSIISLYEDSLRYAEKENKNLIVLFGADWCPDCKALDRMLVSPEIKSLIQKNYIILKVDVGRFDKNLDLDEKLGHPIGKGIPALVILAPNPLKIVASTEGGEFSNASRMSQDQVFAYLKKFGTN
ncbi:thioredoxin family protein [Leptospira ilyithenensis]|uniref:thioredoxin family protein n=1 Tax=Leptospira ilyithenensis TaxID=2484901 RepID=UPI001FEAB13E|nr:thioredoxin family protein [Leptospira ilyithenensis]